MRVLGVVENMAGYVCECCGVSTNVFGKGGGEVMSAEFKVPFLGSVPLDAQWGVMVEEGTRPRYGGAGRSEGRSTQNWNNGDAALDTDGGMFPGGNSGAEDKFREQRHEEESTSNRHAGAESALLLVDKYRSCALQAVFVDVARQVVQNVREEG